MRVSTGNLVNKRPGLMASLGYLVLSLVYTWPLLPNFFSGIPRGWPDSYQNLWNFWWVRSSLFERFSNPYVNNTLFFPYRGSADPLPLYIYTLQPIVSIPGGLLSAVLGQTIAYNLIILVGYVSTGWAAFALTRYFVGSQYQLAAFLAGAIYTFAPYHQHSLARGQTNVFWQQFIPLYILFLHKSFSKDSPRRLYPMLAIVCLWLTFLSDWYYFAYLGLYSVALYLFLVWKSLSKSRKKEFYNWRELTARAGIIGIGALALPAPILWKALTYPQDGFIIYNYSQKTEETILESTSLFSWFQPQRNSFNGWTPDYLSILTLLLAGLGVWACLKRFQMCWVWWWVGLLVVTLILSLGPYLRLTSSEDSAQTLKSGFPLPYQLLEKLPLLDYSRSPLRLLSLSTLALSLLAGAGMAWLFPRVANFRLRLNLGQAVPALILVVLMADTLSLPVTLDSLYYPKFLEQIAHDPDTSYGLLELPITSHYTRDNRRMFFQSIHHHPITSGYISRRVVQYYDDREPIGRFFSLAPQPPEAILPDNPQPQLKVLQLYNVGYVLLYRDEGIFTEAEIEGQRVYLNGLLGNSVFDDGRTIIYKVPPSAAKPALAVNTEGGYEPQKLEDGTNYRWSDGAIRLQLITAKDGTEAQLDFKAWSLPPDNKLTIKLNGAPLQTLPLTQGPQPFSLKLKLKAGRNFVSFESNLPASYPQDLKLPFSDTRKLAFALGEVRLK